MGINDQLLNEIDRIYNRIYTFIFIKFFACIERVSPYITPMWWVSLLLGCHANILIGRLASSKRLILARFNFKVPTTKLKPRGTSHENDT